jgi:hypothetical protein
LQQFFSSLLVRPTGLYARKRRGSHDCDDPDSPAASKYAYVITILQEFTRTFARNGQVFAEEAFQQLVGLETILVDESLQNVNKRFMQLFSANLVYMIVSR